MSSLNNMSSPVHGRYPHLAPLASLDCSISEPLSANQIQSQRQQQQQQQANPGLNHYHFGERATETPTLSSYFDCDQLSDMVDDSLFEITNVGCLSRSVFNRGSRSEIVENDQLVDAANKNNGNNFKTNKLQVQEAASKLEHFNDNNNHHTDDDDACRTPTNETIEPIVIERGDSISVKRPEEVDRIISQVAALAHFRPYDYSSTTKVPNSIGGIGSGSRSRANSSSVSNKSRSNRNNQSSHQRQSKTSGRPECHRRGKFASEAKLTDFGDNYAPADINIESPLRNNAHEASHANADENVCKICNSKQGWPKSEPEKSAKAKKEKRRFAFSLFNLFTGFTSASDNHNRQKQHEESVDGNEERGGKLICFHKQPTLPIKQSTSLGDMRKSHSQLRKARSGVTLIKSNPNAIVRDSIKVTNQRKQRYIDKNANGNNIHNNNNSEILLDFSRPKNIMSGTKTFKGNSNDNFSTIAGPDETQPKQQIVKCVKFTMPGMVMSTNDSSRFKLNPNHPNSSALEQQPPSSIIKRTNIPKSSSCSQTDSSKFLDELLAKYDSNNDLIEEINVKLKLTELIASPKSALDEEEPEANDAASGPTKANERN